MNRLFTKTLNLARHPELGFGSAQSYKMGIPKLIRNDRLTRFRHPELVSGSKWIFKLFLLAFCFSSPSFAQIEINGSIDFEASYGGKKSSFITNEIVEEFRRPHLGINQFNLFMFAGIDENFFFNGRLQWDTWGTGELNPVKITLAALSWEPEDLPINFTLGRFVSPFGLYPRRQLASENLFVNAPLAYGYFINMSDTRGLWGNAGNEGNYGTDDVGLTTIYFGGYGTGIMTNWVIVPELVDLSVAVTNAAPASQENFTNLQNMAVVGRFGFQPIIYWQHGISFSHGSFLRRESVNINFNRLEKFRQTLIGTDFIIAYAYFEISGEAIYSLWNVPAVDANGFQVTPKGKMQTYDLTNASFYVDLKFEPPFFTGSYVAARFESLMFEEFTNPEGSTLNAPNPWDENLIRYSAAFGYKVSRNVLLKFAFSEQIFENKDLKKEDFTFRSILTVTM
ncbi:MAG: hypothetical protein D8M58_20515 [Calditrichaeota bacterium]|nr:MAG: hypothetical protein DWQ03_00845 [Calditrichota bacterium]MBL1207794.1 hypothetical protein [Calditrichota bacterium]NOG47628.1 hypothetical protein [Calditrichota bacterium]